MSTHDFFFSSCTTIYCTSFLIFQLCTIFFSPDFFSLKVLLSHEFMALVVCQPPAASACPCVPAFPAALMDHLWNSWTSSRGSVPTKLQQASQVSSTTTTLQCFGLEDWMLSCAVLLVQLQYLCPEPGPWLEKCFVQLNAKVCLFGVLGYIAEGVKGCSAVSTTEAWISALHCPAVFLFHFSVITLRCDLHCYLS